MLNRPSAIEQAVRSLLQANEPVGESGFPAVSSNGGIVYVVRRDVGDQQALAVAGALAGEEGG